LRGEDVIRKYGEALNGGQDLKARATDREGWRIGCVTRKPRKRTRRS